MRLDRRGADDVMAAAVPAIRRSTVPLPMAGTVAGQDNGAEYVSLGD